jgi:hypothetical protein
MSGFGSASLGNHLHILSCINEEAPPEDVEEAKEDACSEASNVGSTQVKGSHGAKTRSRAEDTNRSDEHELATSVPVDVECRPTVAKTDSNG